MFGRGHKNLGRGTLTQPRPDEFGMRQRSGEYFAPNNMLSLFGMDFALKIGGEDQKHKTRSSSQNLRLLDYVHLICLAVSNKKCLWLPVFGQKFARCAATKVYSRLGSTSSDLGDTARNAIPSA